MLSLTILRYNDAHSRSLVLDLIKVMFSKHAVVVAKSVHSTILEVMTTFILSVFDSIKNMFRVLDAGRTPRQQSPWPSQVWQLWHGAAL